VVGLLKRFPLELVRGLGQWMFIFRIPIQMTIGCLHHRRLSQPLSASPTLGTEPNAVTHTDSSLRRNSVHVTTHHFL